MNTKKLSLLRPYIISMLLFVVYIIALPEINTYFVPCLKGLSMTPYDYQECNISLALNRFLALSILGFAISTLGLFFLVKKKSLKALGATAIVLAAISIIGYYAYVSIAQKAVLSAEIYLDSLL